MTSGRSKKNINSISNNMSTFAQKMYILCTWQKKINTKVSSIPKVAKIGRPEGENNKNFIQGKENSEKIISKLSLRSERNKNQKLSLQRHTDVRRSVLRENFRHQLIIYYTFYQVLSEKKIEFFLLFRYFMFIMYIACSAWATTLLS